ncbi:MAG: LysR family transcriptional regulator [Desulfuromonadales bacterium]|nr:LysR family transcriptional regulator [Desulfuromonadales bacterium]MDW7756557.1 LysR family transcriptional regulator [Desulfuromonadales bacterium]
MTRGTLMESTYLKTLLEVVRTGSLTKAADTLCVTQSAISRRIKFMEEQYGYELIDRSGPVLTPTAVGELVVDKARKILEIEQELFSGLGLLKSKKALAFVCTPTFGIIYLPEIMRDFILSNPDTGDLKFGLEMPETIVKGLKEGAYEMAVVEHCQCFDLADFETIPLPGDEMVFAVSSKLNLAGPQASLDDLFEHTLYSRSEGCCSRTLLENNLNNMGMDIGRFNRTVIYDDVHIIVDALIRGEGVGFISTDLIRSHVKEGRLQELRVEGFIHQRNRTFIHSGCLPECNAGRAFVRAIMAHFNLELPCPPL